MWEARRGCFVQIICMLRSWPFKRRISYVKKKYMYYKDPVTTSRPQNANMYVFYEDPEYEIYLMTIDLRPELN